MPDVDVTGQGGWWMQNGSEALGFARPLIETPRSVTSVNGEAIELFGLSAVEDLLRIVPGVFTTTRFGVQGSVDIRAVPADFAALAPGALIYDGRIYYPPGRIAELEAEGLAYMGVGR